MSRKAALAIGFAILASLCLAGCQNTGRFSHSGELPMTLGGSYE